MLQVNARELEGAAASAAVTTIARSAILREAADAERNLGYWEPPHYARPVLESLADAAVRAGRPDAARPPITRRWCFGRTATTHCGGCCE